MKTKLTLLALGVTMAIYAAEEPTLGPNAFVIRPKTNTATKVTNAPPTSTNEVRATISVEDAFSQLRQREKAASAALDAAERQIQAYQKSGRNPPPALLKRAALLDGTVDQIRTQEEILMLRYPQLASYPSAFGRRPSRDQQSREEMAKPTETVRIEVKPRLNNLNHIGGF